MKKSEIQKEVEAEPNPRNRGYWTIDEAIQYLRISFRDGSERIKEFRIEATSLHPSLRENDLYETGTTSFQLNADLKIIKTRFP